MLIHATTPQGAEALGGKANGLRALQNAGVQVPPFFVVPASVFVHFDPQVTSPQLPAEVQTEISDALQSWPWQTQGVAVRSSVVDEDGAEHAFAGMMDSVLNVRTEADLWAAIDTVARSAWSDRALAYRKEKGLTEAIRPAVIVQQMIQPDASGILFSQNPNYPTELAIHAVNGLGEGLVSGQRVPHERYLSRDNAAVVHEEEGEEAVALSDKVLTTLWSEGLRIERERAMPQDMEFCVVGDTVYFVQARAITADIAKLTVYDNSNIQESYCGVTTPLTYSFARRAYGTVYTQTMRVLGLPESRIAEKQAIVQNLLGLVRGRIYYNINNWYRGLQLLPSFKQNKEDMERMMGLQEPVDFIENTRKSLGETVQMLPGLLVNLVRLISGFVRLPKLFRQFRAHFSTHFEAFYTRDLSQLSAQELWAQKEGLDKDLMDRWTTPIINDFYVMMRNGSAMRALEKEFGDRAEEVLKTYVSGDVEIDSIKPTLAMMELAQQARQDSALVEVLRATKQAVHGAVQAQFPTFYTQVEDYLHQYGDRTVGELKLETMTMRVKPDIFYGYLRNYLHDDFSFQLQPESSSAVAAAGLAKKLEKLKRGIHRRESMRLERTRLFGMYRSLFLALGQRLYAAGKLADARDVFYLEEAEIQGLIHAEEGTIPAELANRKAQFAAWEDLYVPARVIEPSRALAQAGAVAVDGVLSGEVVVAGDLGGEAIVIQRPEDDLDVKGKIICALRTDPGWAALFPACKAVLIEKGSSLSHSVILLRELGIPTIINIPGLTQAIKSGQTIRLQGDTGHIYLNNETEV